MIYLSAIVMSMFITIALIPILRDLTGKYLALDLPGGRKIHNSPVPKSGGIAMVLGALLPILFWTPGGSFIISILAGSWIIVIFGLLDDLKDLPYGIKFLGQFLAAFVVVYYGGLKIRHLGGLLPGASPLPDVFAIPLTMIVVVGVTNAINLSDGLDGLAGGISLLCFICIGYLAFLDGNKSVVVVCTAMIGSILGFLRFNTYPASIFMGDAGSQLLGFLSGTLSLSLTQKKPDLSPLLPLLIMGLPIMDTLRVMGDRILQGKMPFKPDTRHLHHRLMNLGLYHSETVLAIYCLHAALITFAFVFRHYSGWFLLLAYIVFSLAIILGLAWSEKLKWRRDKTGFFDTTVKARMRWLKDKQVFIKTFFKLLEVGGPLLLIITCLISATIPFFFSVTAVVCGCILMLVRSLKPEWTGIALKLAVYSQVPLIIYQSAVTPATWANLQMLRSYNVFFGLVAFVAVLVLKFTKRKNGFKTTSMDFLILFIALVIPNIPDAQIRSYQMGIIAAKIITIYYSYEVLIGELRKNYNRLSYVTTLTLFLICARGVFGV
jgi:UDP-GlcNAc:undecaprenyl-phosphate/decaprenyl-phosphate GlcNAc-1-phosphate transferase